ncbi:putative transporter of the nramp family [Moniliophthora roreri MCA 2997]|uniref:Transporter of the nramp family n=1 Tax=Moniliophthora roreri (strain MCA 2997) TaxID=1381753 RepID=V2WNQ4_MONRO|nr:putative transporter of the nramp family [Moniliophthora roreri MCA 2997]
MRHSIRLNETTTTETECAKNCWKCRFFAGTRTVLVHIRKHTGVGLVCAVAYFDPGNWGVDLQAGSEYGYRLLFVVLLAGLFAVFFQTMASRMGCVTGLDLASHCRLLLHSRPKHTLLWRWLALYPLYFLSEVAIIATDLAELLGSAIALCLLFPKLELWHGVLITAFDVIILLALGDPLRGTPVRMFEWLIGAMVLAVFICMCIIISRVDIHWGTAFQGYLPSKYIIPNGALFVSVGIIGATVMPHSLFLGSALATQDRVSTAHCRAFPKAEASQSNSDDVESEDGNSEVKELTTRTSLIQHLKTYPCRLWTWICEAFKVPPPSSYATVAKRHSERENNSYAFVVAHVYHGIVDVAISLLGFAVLINSFILILASAVFYYGNGLTGENAGKDAAGLFDAYDLIKDLVGPGAATLFAIALLAAGQSSSIIATVAGQAVSEGFLQWRVSPVVRRLLTRLLAVIPAMVVAIAIGRTGIDTLLVLSQVVLSIVLPFITLPLIYVTSSKELMSVRVPAKGEESGETTKDFSNSWFSTVIAYAIWLLVTIANIYVLATLGNE